MYKGGKYNEQFLEKAKKRMAFNLLSSAIEQPFMLAKSRHLNQAKQYLRSFENIPTTINNPFIDTVFTQQKIVDTNLNNLTNSQTSALTHNLNPDKTVETSSNTSTSDTVDNSTSNRFTPNNLEKNRTKRSNGSTPEEFHSQTITDIDAQEPDTDTSNNLKSLESTLTDLKTREAELVDYFIELTGIEELTADNMDIGEWPELADEQYPVNIFQNIMNLNETTKKRVELERELEKANAIETQNKYNRNKLYQFKLSILKIEEALNTSITSEASQITKKELLKKLDDYSTELKSLSAGLSTSLISHVDKVFTTNEILGRAKLLEMKSYYPNAIIKVWNDFDPLQQINYTYLKPDPNNSFRTIKVEGTAKLIDIVNGKLKKNDYPRRRRWHFHTYRFTSTNGGC